MFSIDHMKEAGSCTQCTRGEMSSLAFVIWSERFLKCQLVRWYFGFTRKTSWWVEKTSIVT